MLVAADSYLLEPRAAEVIEAAGERNLPGRVKSELFACVVELNTGVCETVDAADSTIVALRRAAADLAAERGLRLFAAGSHPISPPEEQPIAAEERYRAFVDYAGVTARRQGVNGLHVHVGMPTADACFHALEGVLPWLPVVLALSVNSPYLSGAETGLASTRAEVLAQLPRAGSPPAFRDYGEWEAFVDRLVRLGLMADYTTLWWDVRPHPRFGTLEVRMPDQPTCAERTSAFAALVQALAVWALERERLRYDPPARAVYQQNRWAASRLGPDAELVHPDGDRLVRAGALATELAERVGPVADELGSRARIESLLEVPSEAQQQLAVGRTDGLEAVCADVAERSLASVAS